jgi:hypothetical protein
MGCGATAPTDEIKEIPGGFVAIIEPSNSDGSKQGRPPKSGSRKPSQASRAGNLQPGKAEAAVKANLTDPEPESAKPEPLSETSESAVPVTFEEPPVGNLASPRFAGGSPMAELAVKDLTLIKYKFSDDEK